MKRAIPIVLVGLAFAAAGWAASEFGWVTRSSVSALLGREAPPSDGESPTEDDQPRTIHALGRLQPAGGVFSVSTLPGQRIESLEVVEGQEDVTKDDLLATLESYAVHELELELVRKQRSEAEQRRDSSTALAEVQIETAELAKQQAEAEAMGIDAQRKKIKFLEESLELADKDLAAMEGLSPDIVSPQEVSRQRLVRQQTEAELEAARAMLEQMEKQADLALSAADEKIRLAKTNRDSVEADIPVESLKVREQQAEKQLARAQIKAPCAGTILKVFVQEGELAGAGPILQMADLSQMVVEAEVHEADISQIHKGQKAMIYSRAIPACRKGDKIAGTVERIGKMVATPGLDSLDPFAPQDLHVVEVRIKLNAEMSRACREYVNLQVDVEFLPK